MLYDSLYIIAIVVSRCLAKECTVGANDAPDIAQSLSLLWGDHDKAGRSGLTVRQIVGAATALADAEGLAALSMRRVAQALGVGTMSLYPYIHSKDALIEVMYDLQMAALYEDVEEAASQPSWQEGVRFIAAQNWQLYYAHPWLCTMDRSRPVLGPNITLNYEAELRVLDAIGLSEVEMDAFLSAIHTQVIDAAARSAQHAQVIAESEQSDKDWWLKRAPILERLMAGRHFPTADRVSVAVGEAFAASSVTPQVQLDFSIQALILGVEGLLAARAT